MKSIRAACKQTPRYNRRERHDYDRPWVRIVFDDHGVGIAPQALTMLTKPFFSTKPFGKGTGLGLNITQKIITDHGGTLRFESIEGEGARVIMELPVHQNDAEAEA
jgi:two-component system, NtrC family, sensor kinase